MPSILDKTHLSVVFSSIPIIFIIGVVIPALLLYGPGRGAELWDNTFKFIFYVGMLLFALIVVVVEQLTKDRSVGTWFKTYFFNPEQGVLNNFSLFRNPVKLLMLSWIIAGFLGTISIVSNTFFITAPTYQILPIAAIGLSAEPASGAETLTFFAVLLGLVYGISKAISKKNKIVFVTLLIIGALVVGGVIFPAYHVLRYGSDEQSLLGVAFFGVSNSLLTIITGSVFTGWMWHIVNNGLNEAKTLFSKDIVLVVWLVFWFISSSIFAWIIFNWKEKPKTRGA
jgi:hypothetical protein